MMEMGMEVEMMRVERKLRRNTHITSMASRPPTSISLSTW